MKKILTLPLSISSIAFGFVPTLYSISSCSCAQFCTVVFNTNGGSLIETINVEKGRKITKPDNPTKDFNYFVGWYIDPECTVEFDFNSEIHSNITLYAGWSPWHTSFTEKNKTTLNISKYTITLDKEDYKLDDFSFDLSGKDFDKLVISDKKIEGKNLFLYIKPLQTPTVDNTPFSFNIKISHKDGWVENYDSLILNFRIVDDQIKSHDEQSWKHAIEHIASCKHPTIFIATDASYFLQQAANIYLAASQLAIENNWIYSTPGYEYNDLIFLIPRNNWNCKKQTPGSGEAVFWCIYKNLVDSKFGFSDIITNSKSAGTQIDLSLGNQMILCNMQDFNLELDDYDETKPDYETFDGFNWNVNFINKLMDMYESIDPDIKFNFVATDYCWNNICNLHYENDAYARLQTRMFRKMDKIYLLSDGAWTWVDENRFFCDFYKKNGYISSAEQDEIMSKLKSLDFEKAVEYYKTLDPFIFFNNEKYFLHFQASEKTTFASCNIDNDNVTKESTYKSTAPLLLTNSYKDYFNEEQNYQNYRQAYLDFFHYSDDGFSQKFSDYVAFDTYSNYDFNKKNLIFCLPGAFRASKKPSEELWISCRNILDKIKISYPIDKWNYIYKFHPRCTSDDIETTFNKLFDSESRTEWPKNTIVLTNTFPFEYLITIDKTLVDLGKETHYHLIDPSTFSDDKPSGIMTGFDLSSTCYYGAMSMLVNEYNMSWDNVKKLIQTDAFYLPRNFQIPNGYDVDGKDYSNENKQNTVDFYKSLYQTNEFINPDDFKFVDD